MKSGRNRRVEITVGLVLFSVVVGCVATTLSPGASAIDLGCGSGIPITEVLVAKGLNVYAVDAAMAGHYFDVMPGGKRFLFIKENNQPQVSTEINIVLNWFDELKRLMGAQKP